MLLYISTLKPLDLIQRKAIQIIGVTEATTDLNIASLHHRHVVAVATVLYRMHTKECPADLKPIQLIKMPSHALREPVSRTNFTGRTFKDTAVQTRNKLPDHAVGDINDDGSRTPVISNVYHVGTDIESTHGGNLNTINNPVSLTSRST